MNRVAFFTVFSSMIICLPLKAQNMASIEFFFSRVSLVYGFDNHPIRYTQCKMTVDLLFGGTIDFYNPSINAELNKWFKINYWFSLEQRYYYNLIKRQSKDKKTLHKSANFLSIKPSYIFQQYKDQYERLTNHISYCSVNWGMRRAVGKRFYFEGSIGAGPSYSTNNRTWAAMADVNLCFGFKLF